MKITLYSVDNTIRSAVRKAFQNDEVLEITDSSKFSRGTVNERRQEATLGRLALPDEVDYVVSKAALNSKTEGLAATLGLRQGRGDVYAVVLPEGLDWLRDQLGRRGSLVLVGSDQAK